MDWVLRSHLIDVGSLHCCLCLFQDACVHARHKTGALKERYPAPCRAEPVIGHCWKHLSGRTRHGPGGRHELRLFGSHGQNLPDKLHDAVRAFYKMRFCCRRFFTAIRMAAVRIFTDKSDPKHRPNGLLCHRYFCKIEKHCCMCFSLFAAPAFSRSQVLLVSHHTDRANSGYRSVYVSSRRTKSAVI